MLEVTALADALRRVGYGVMDMQWRICQIRSGASKVDPGFLLVGRRNVA